jgi:tRNA(Arg) A34 adenosine deaminase TadA
MFTEILPVRAPEPTDPRYLDVYVAEVETTRCGPLINHLSIDLPLKQSQGEYIFDLTHLKRVKRTTIRERKDCIADTTDETSSVGCSIDGRPPSMKRRRRNDEIRLEIVLGPVLWLEKLYTSAPDELKTKYELVKVYKCEVPARHAESVEEGIEFSAAWPISFFANKTPESFELRRQVSQEEIEQMRNGMEQAIEDVFCQSNSERNGVVVINPETGQVLARSADEQNFQSVDPGINPLATSVILAIQGVSRLERQAALRHGMDNNTFHSGSYLCTGYDVYTTLEPSVFESMALVHARIRRLVFGCRRSNSVGGLTKMAVHALPGTNHKYRVFACTEESELEKRCVACHNRLNQ